MLERRVDEPAPAGEVHGDVHHEVNTGLTTAEVERRRAAGQGNSVEDQASRSVAGIVRANVLTRFNAIIAALTVVVLVFGQPIDAVFGLVMILNSAIGIAQELRAKRSLDAIRVLVVPSIEVVRDGRSRRVPPEELVLGDVIGVEAGDQIPVDGTVITSQGLEVDESALTGESRPVPKAAGDEILSGSVAVSGAATAAATRVGASSFAHRLTTEAKNFVLTRSELKVGIDRLLTFVSWALVPLAALLVWSQLQSSASLAEGLVSAVAGVVGLVPQGLVLLVSLTFAIAVTRLAKEHVVVQELPAVEGLARVDVLCVDKTGTLTTGRLTLDGIDPLGIDAAELRAGLGALCRLDSGRSGTIEALRSGLAAGGATDPGWGVTSTVAFSSVRKWSGATFDGHGTWVLGAPEILLDSMVGERARSIAVEIEELASSGRRVLLAARTDGPLGPDDDLPTGLRPVGVVRLREQVRPDAAATVAYFRQQGVEVKVISGDNPRTVAAVAAELGIPGAANHVDLRHQDDLRDIPPDTTIFGRVRPEQKRDLVHALQAQGHIVAMTGDGVNDIPALKAADIGIAMDTASPATKAVAQLVLLDGRFERLPSVVGEGRRVIANMERVSSLFVTKTVYAALLALVVGVARIDFPFLPRHLTLIGAITIGIPGFVLSFVRSNERCRPGYLSRVLHFAVPAGTVAAAATLASFWLARSGPGGADLEQARTAATVTLTLVGIWIVYLLIRPIDRFEATLLGALILMLIVVVTPSPWSNLYGLRLPPAETAGIVVAVTAAMIVALQLALRIRDRIRGGGPAG